MTRFKLLQVFRSLELPAEFERLNEMKTILLLRREELITSINNTNIKNLSEWVN
jgi:hypothetical protein